MKAKRKSQRRKARKAKKVKNARRAKRSPRRKLRRAVGRFLPARIFAGLPAHGNTKWSPRVLAIVALLFTLSNEDTLAERHEMSRDIAGLADGERTQFRSLLRTLPRRALIVADAGFVGYDLWKTIRRGGRHFLIRVGGNVELLHSLVPGCRIERDGQIVWLWPAGVQKKKAPPLTLRLITVQQGRRTWYLATSLLDPELLNERGAARLYARRWGIECCFRTLKQTCQRHTMRSYTPECAAAELDWALLSLWLVSLLTKQELHEAKIDMDHYSPAGARRLIRRELRRQAEGKEELDVSEFRNAVKDSYKRNSKKTARHDQRKKRDPAPSAPTIKKATNAQRQAANALEQSQPTAA